MGSLLRSYLEHWKIALLGVGALFVAGILARLSEQFSPLALVLDSDAMTWVMGGSFFATWIGAAWAYDCYREWRFFRPE